MCGLNDLFSNITRISKLVGQEVKKRRRRHSCRAAIIDKTGINAVLPRFYGTEHSEGINDTGWLPGGLAILKFMTAALIS